MDFSKDNTLKESPMVEEEFGLFRELIGNEFGIEIKGDKRLTFHTKLSHRLTILGLKSYKDYYDLIISDPSQEELYRLISHITNNETYFQREKDRVPVFTSLLSDIKKCKQVKNQKRVNILSAGCSSGEEVYTLNIALMESGLLAWGWEVNFLGVDADKIALRKAEAATYTRNSFRAVGDNEGFLEKYFHKKDGSFILKKPYRSNVRFKHTNIMKPGFLSEAGAFDVIFWRNVLIYMSDKAIARAAENLYNHLEEDGYLVIGSSESLLNKTELFVPEHRNGVIVYRKNPFICR